MAKQKIFHLITLSEPGGAQRYISDLVNYSTGTYDYTIISAPGGSGFRKTKCRKIYLDNLCRPIRPFTDYQIYCELTEIFKNEQPGVVHCHSSKAGLLGRLAAKRAGVPKIIYTVHGFVFREALNPLVKLLYYSLEKWLAARTDVLICVSRDDYELAVRKKFKAGKIVYIPNGLNLSAYRPGSTARQKGLRGICAANFYKTKGHALLVEAMRQGGAKAKDIVIDFAGGFGHEQKKVESLIKKYKLTGQFRFLGYHSDLPKLLPRYDFFILPSLKEGFPYVILEALASGLPVIATRTGGIPDVVKHKKNGYLCAPGSAAELRDALVYLAQGGQLQPKRAILESYAVRNIVKQVEKLY